MGVDAMRIAVHTRKFVFFATTTSYTSIRRHPFLVVMLCFFIFLYRSFPFLFSLFVSASPVLVCTAVLLGTLLSYGQPNIPEIEDEEEEEEEEEEVSHDIASLKTGLVEDSETTIVERGGSFTIEEYVGNDRGIVQNIGEEAKGVDNSVSEEGLHSGKVVDKSLQEVQCEEEQVIEETERKSDAFSNSENKHEIHHGLLGISDRELSHEDLLGASDGENVADQYCLLGKENDQFGEFKDDGSPGDLEHTDKEDFFPSSSWKQGGDHGSDDDRSSDSDGAESSSPDASMTDIMPMLDELHPLLDLDAPQPAHGSHDESESEFESESEDGSSERSHKSEEIQSSDDSDEDLEKKAEEEDGEEDERAKEEDGSPFVITWDETDQKNLMELGTLEIERNKRLESLIARRRLRKSMKIMSEKNLIDFDGVDLPFNVPSISTARQNPFDLPFDSYDDLGLPPIPGSAPSIMQPRRNPFDLPYDSNEEKPDLKGDSFNQEFAGFQQREVLQQRETGPQREAFFRRHESFSVGPSSLGGHRWDRHDNRFKPFFVPEEGTSYHPLQRQFSEVSESKASSVPDTESVISAVDDEDKKLNISQETEFISSADQTAELVEHGSQSSDIDSLDTEQAEKRDVLQDEVEIILGDHEIVSGLTETGTESQIDLNTEPVEDDCSSRSSISSLSEVDDRISSNMSKEEESSSLEPLKNNQIEEFNISTQPSFAESDFHFASEVGDENHHREPVYDSSPPAMDKILSFNSISSDTQSEAHEIDSSSQIQEVIDNQSGSRAIVESSKQDVVKEELPGVVSDHDNPNGHVEPEAVNEQDLDDVTSSSRNTESIKEHVNRESVLEHNSVDSRLFDLNTESTAYKELASVAPDVQEPSPLVEHVSTETEPKEDMLAKEAVHELEKDEIHSSSSSYNESGEDGTILDVNESEVKQVPSSNSNAEIHNEKESEAKHTEAEHVEEHSSDEGDNSQFDQDQAQSSYSHVKVDDGFPQSAANLETSFSGSGHLDGSSEESSDVRQEPSNILAESNDDVSITSGPVQEAHDREEKISTVTFDEASIRSESPEFKSPTAEEDLKESLFDQIVYEDHGPSLLRFHSTVETFGFNDSEQNIYDGEEAADEIHEIDEGLLSELDSVGDFNVKESVSESLHTEKLPEESSKDEIELAKDSKLTETSLELPVLEVRSVEDVDLAFKQLEEGASVEEVILPSMIEDQLKDSVETNSDMAVVEARSLEDLNNALKESNVGEQINPSESNENEVEKNEPVSRKKIESDENEVDRNELVSLKEIESDENEVDKNEPVFLKEIESDENEVDKNELVSPKKIISDSIESGMQEGSTATVNDNDVKPVIAPVIQIVPRGGQGR
ncbi:hypothetical protein ACFE04_027334 [Oxalis oulophora]